MEINPSGIVTFLFTDIEGSAKLAQKFPDSLESILQKHDTILKTAIEKNNGFIFKKIDYGSSGLSLGSPPFSSASKRFLLATFWPFLSDLGVHAVR